MDPMTPTLPHHRPTLSLLIYSVIVAAKIIIPQYNMMGN